MTADVRLRMLAQFRRLGRCADCGRSGLEVALEFDHRDPTGKQFSLGHLNSASFKKLIDEIEKCDLVCRPCHLIRGKRRNDPFYGQNPQLALFIA